MRAQNQGNGLILCHSGLLWLVFGMTVEIKSLVFLSHVFTFQVAPFPEHYIDFANLAGKVAER